ncbi:MAG TPA: plastocyanin/azurin family copper-binding protein, partial [Gemmatimonadaceae bacterium]
FGDVAHNVFFDNAPAGAPDAIAGANANMSQARTFTTAGTFEYNCHIHPGMKGTVVVSNTSSAPPAGGGGLGY